jgi:dissimilatory sulfite reductase (desulfoviridin) alpha/beta subunit
MKAFGNSPIQVTDRRHNKVGAQVTVGGKIGKGKSALAPATSKVDAFVSGFSGTRTF